MPEISRTPLRVTDGINILDALLAHLEDATNETKSDEVDGIVAIWINIASASSNNLNLILFDIYPTLFSPLYHSASISPRRFSTLSCALGIDSCA